MTPYLEVGDVRERIDYTNGIGTGVVIMPSLPDISTAVGQLTSLFGVQTENALQDCVTVMATVELPAGKSKLLSLWY